MVLTGTYERSLDGKARVLLPKRMRSEVAEFTSIFLTPGTDQCLELHTPDSLNEMAQRASHSGSGSKNVKSFSRLFYSKAQQCDVDGQGRIRIPHSLVRHADLDKEIVIIGVGFNWEIWNPENWQAYLQDHETGFDDIAEATFDNVVGQANLVEQESIQGNLNAATGQSNEDSVHRTKPK